MMNRPSRLKATRVANKLIEDYCIQLPSEIILENILPAEGVFFQERKMSRCLGSLIRKGGRGIVSVSEDIWHQGQKRFVLAHELGHWLLHTDMPNFNCNDEDMLAWHSASSKYEIEANTFAATFLMPEEMFQRECKGKPFSSNLIIDLSDTFNTSKSSTALRFADVGTESLMVVFSKDGIVKWSKHSDDFRFKFYENGFPIPSSTATHSYYKSQAEIAEPETTLASTWFSKDRSVKGDQYLYEHILPQPSINACLTFLWEHEINFEEENFSY